MEKTIDTKYDELNVNELQKRLKRIPTPSEVTNSNNDSDLVTEIMWQLIKELEARIKILEKKR